MTDVQAIIIDIFKSFAEICVKYSLQYFAIGGTCLGAIRHRGFIPWDDDLDVVMPYEDYCKFIEIAPIELPSKYEVYSEYQHPHWYRNYIKIQDKFTTYAEDESQEFNDRFTGVFMDVMPFLNLPKSRMKQKYLMMMNCYYLNMNRIQRLYYLNDNKTTFGISRKVIYCLLKLTQLGHGDRKKTESLYTDLMRDLYENMRLEKSDRILFVWRNSIEILFRSAYKYKLVFPYDSFSSFLEVPFEETMIRVPIGYNDYLRREFGDYMRIPPKEKQIQHNPVIVDLNHPYNIYMGGVK